jgi:hypothetical protein
MKVDPMQRAALPLCIVSVTAGVSAFLVHDWLLGIALVLAAMAVALGLVERRRAPNDDRWQRIIERPPPTTARGIASCALAATAGVILGLANLGSPRDFLALALSSLRHTGIAGVLWLAWSWLRGKPPAVSP